MGPLHWPYKFSLRRLIKTESTFVAKWPFYREKEDDTNAFLQHHLAHISTISASETIHIRGFPFRYFQRPPSLSLL